MDCLQKFLSVDEEDLLDELPERCLFVNNKNEETLLDMNKDDSGLGISESMEGLKENLENSLLEEMDCETNDVITDSENKNLPELIPLPNQIESIQNNISGTELNRASSDSNTMINDEKLPELQPISEIMSYNRNNSISDDNSSIIIGNGSRRSSASSFIDSLLDKLRQNSDSSGSEISPKKIIKESKNSDEDLLVEINKSVLYTKSSNPNMLPTPVVENQSISSAFVNSEKEYKEAVERIKRKSSSGHDDKSKMTSKSQPPRMKPPKLPSNIQHPRTLAQKRLLLANNLKFHMIEQESKIYRQIQRKINRKELNFQLIEDLADNEIPIKHGPWKALSWLRTQDGNYIQQYVNIDEQNYKLSGSRGNHHNKFIPSQSCKPFPKNQTTSLRSVRCCEGGKVKKRILDNLVNVDSIKRFVLEGNLSPYKKLEAKSLHNQLSSIKPRPLTKKIEYINKNLKLTQNDEDILFLGDFMQYKLPNIKLEVKPQKKIPLDPKAKQYLNEIIPYRDMNQNWINFSLSTLTTKDENEESNETFEFKIPYCNGKQHILVREILKQPDTTDLNSILNDDVVDEMKWTFDENCDKNDHLEMEIVEIIKDLTNSVYINLNDDLFTKDDPIDRTPTFIAPIKAKEAIEEITSTSKNMKIDQSKKMLLELRRLNANVVKSDSTRVDDDEDIRRHALAHLAKDERELRPTVIVTESDTVLLSNKKTETRRQKRAPKRYSDYMHPEDVNEHEKETLEPPKKVKPKELIDEPFKTRAQCVDTGMTHEEMKTLKEEIKKWIHVNVEITKLEGLDDIQPYCLDHYLYRCSCKNIAPQELINESNFDYVEKESSSIEDKNNETEVIEIPDDQQCVSESSPEKILSASDKETETEIDEISKIENENSRRVLPIDLDKHRKSVCEVTDENDLEEENKENAPKMEILNISELVNGGIGPIYINIYDTKVNRLNPIFRSILNNKSALVYLDGLGYYLDMKRIDVMKLKFDTIREDLEHPVFIIRPKIHSPSDDQSKICGDFVNLLFKEDSELLLQLRDKILLKEVAKIIEIILQSVRKKIETQIGCEPSDFVKEQLSLITRDRSNSNTSVSSADTSPLHFNGKQLECAPSPGFDTEMMKEFNKIFSMRMQRLCAIINSNSLGLHPLDTFINKFYIYKWSLLLQSFEEDLINIWQVKMVGESDLNYFAYVITNTSKPPIVEKVESENIVNIKNLSLSNTSTLVRMVLLKMENFNTKFMTMILFGCKGYFRICGVLNSKENYFNGISAKPTKRTHPRLTAKIQKVYNIWYGLKKANSVSSYLNKSNQIESFKEEIKDENVETDVESKMQLNDETEPKLNSKQPSTYKWFLFNISNDFSDIYIKQWKNYLPYKIIMNTINKARMKQRTVRILGPVNSAKDTPRIFALPRAPLKFRKEENENMTGNFLLFGPYLRDSNSNLLLMQNVDGKMILRDDYEQKNNIQRSSRTRCLWIYANSLKCVTDSYIECFQPDWAEKCDTDCNAKNEASLNSETKKSPMHRHSDEQRKKIKISSIIGGLKKVL